MRYLKVAPLIAGLNGISVQSFGFSTECTDISLIDAWLVGTCPTDNGTGEITSSVYLPSKIENSQGKLAVCYLNDYICTKLLTHRCLIVEN